MSVKQSQCSAQGQVFHCKLSFSTLPSSQPSFSYLYTVHLLYCCLSSDILFCNEFSSHLPYLLEHPAIGSSFLASGTANFLSSSLSVPALFFVRPLFLAQQHFFVMSESFYTLHSSPYPHLKCFQSFFSHSALVSKFLHHTTLHFTQSTSLVSSYFFFQGTAENTSLPVKSF